MSDTITNNDTSNPAVRGFEAFVEKSVGMLKEAFTTSADPNAAIIAGQQAYSNTGPKQVAEIDCSKPTTMGNQKAYIAQCM